MPEPPPPEPPSPTSGQLFSAFFGISLMGFGGVLPWTRRMIVEQRRWLTGPEFTDLLAICQFIPGSNVLNMAVSLGLRFRGIPGALAGVCGLLAMPMLTVIGLGAVYGQFSELPAVRRAFAGLAAAASGLIIAMALRIAWPLRASRAGLAVVAVTFVLIAGLRLPLLAVLAVLAPASIILLRRFPG